jgi:hypothetical protein
MVNFFRSRRNLLLTFLGVAALGLVCGWLFSPLALVVRSADRVGLVLTITPGSTFSLRFIHSVHRTPVLENFTVAGPDKLNLVSTEYESYGVGMPSLPSEGKFAQLNGRFLLTGLDRHFSEIPVRVGPEARLTLIYDNKEYPLHELFEPGTLLYIGVKPNPFGLLYHRPFN